MYDEMEMNNVTEAVEEVTDLVPEECGSGVGKGVVIGALGVAAVYGVAKGVKWLIAKAKEKKALKEAEETPEAKDVKDIEIEVVK